ncbi:MAG: PHP domain-containing protein [Paenibacillaceae bacterium]
MRKLWDNQKGSQWRKWDLHIHSTYSKESRAKLTIKNIFDSAIASGISVVAITDHSNVKALDEIWKVHAETFEFEGTEHNYSDYIEFIPGVELKTDKGNKPIHMIALFPKQIDMDTYVEKVDTNFLETNFLSKVGCSDSDIRAAGNGDYNAGLLDSDVNFENTCQLVRELGGVIIVHNGTKYGGFDQGLSHVPSIDPTVEELESHFNALKVRLMSECVDICEIPNASKSNLRDRDFYLKKFGKPCIISSDSHENYEGLKYSWIKADPSIEGLKQVLFEPQYRLHLGDSPPFNPVHKIERLLIDFPANTMINGEMFCIKQKTEIVFSPNLTCLIGGRGSGKSTILNLLHEKLQQGKNNFFKNFKLNLPKDKYIKDFVLIDGDEEDKIIEFFSQNEIEEFALNFEKFTESIFPRILKFGDNSSLNTASTELDKYLQKLDTHIKNILNLYTLKETASHYEKKKKTQENIVSSLNDATYLELSQKMDQEDKETRRIKASQEKFEAFVKSLQVLITEHQIIKVENEYDIHRDMLIKLIQVSIEPYSDQNQFTEINQLHAESAERLEALKQELISYLESKGLKDENLADVTSATEEVNRLDDLLLSTNIEIEGINKLINEFSFEDSLKQAYILEINRKVDEHNKSLTNLSSQVKPIGLKYEFNSEKAKLHLLKLMMTEFSNLESFQNIKQNDVEKHLFSIEPEALTDKSSYIESLQRISNTKTKTSIAMVDYFSNDVNFVSFKLHVKRAYSDVNAFRVIRVNYDGKQLENTSFGQRCTAAIILLIKLGNTPIIIDEPEAHLDSMLVANYLVELIKESKQHRQIIFATHNANFAINGDAELINILEVDLRNETNIIPTTIEDLLNRDKLLQLEGGKIAFQTREKKYKIK